jgi:RecB family exonuclease
VKLGRARIIGTVESRLEVEADGSLFIIDFKTGNTAISKDEAKKNLQLASYQLGVHEVDLPMEIRVRVPNLCILEQVAQVHQSASSMRLIWKRRSKQLKPTGEGMGAATFFATVNKRCKGCPVRKSCPVQSDGQAVIE